MVSNTVMVVPIATGEKEEVVTPASAGAALGKLGEGWAAGMTPEPRAEIAKKAATAPIVD